MAKQLPISPTLLNTFLTCPRQYEAKYITKEVVFQQSEAAAYGDRIHKAVEAALTLNAALPPEAAYMQPLVDWCRTLAAKDGVEMMVEEALAITSDLQPCGWWGDKSRKAPAWQRGKADVFFVDHINKVNIIVDWKTGKVKDDKTQSHLLSLCATKRTGYSKSVCLWVFCTKDELVAEDVDLLDLTPISTHMANVRAYEKACRDHEFPALRNGLCRQWCDVHSCIHNGKNPANIGG